VSPTALAVPGLGAISLAVLGAVFQQKRLGGDAPLEAWARHHQRNGDRGRELVTFGTLKHRSRDMKAERAEKKRARKRRRERTREVPVERFGSAAEVSS
jgi:hypothetical protein